ncbi:unnamed protein product, partial [Medioppia subpectinata]
MCTNTHPSLRHDLNYKTWPIFTKDNAPDSNDQKNNYGQHPFYTVLESNGNSHGILLLNSNAMEYTLMPAPAMSVKTIGGILDFFVFIGDNPEHTIGGILDFFVFIGDNPEHVIQLYTSLIGRTFMPSFWAFGFQISKYGYHNTNQVKAVVERQIKHQIPYDVQYIDSDYKFWSRDFTIDPNYFKDLPQLITETQSKFNLHWTPIIDPGIQGNEPNYSIFLDGNNQNVFVKWPKSVPIQDRHNPDNIDVTHDNMYGRVWPPGPVAFPDFMKNATQNWWINNFKHLYSIGWKFNSLWIDMNEPVSVEFGTGFNITCPHNQYDNIPIEIKALWVHNFERLSRQSICMIGVQGESGQYKHYDVHSLYGLSMAIPTQKALNEITGKRGYVLSRSTFVSSGQYTGHWLGDNRSKWSHMKDSVIGMLEFNLFGIQCLLHLIVDREALWVHGFDRLSRSTLCMIGVQGESGQYKHYDVHSLYGLSMAIPTQKALNEITGKRGYVLSRSTFVSSGQYTGHWLGDNRSKWSHMKDSVIGMLEFNLFGIPYVGADICGFNDKTTPALCRRWQQLGAFYPFSRNHHNGWGGDVQDPAVWADIGHPEVTEAAKQSLRVRYQLLPYLYTLFFKAHVLGNTVVRPLFHEYPTDPQTYGIDEQFMWGSVVLFSPFLYENQTEVNAYLPDDVWYEPSVEFVKLVPKTGHVKLQD